MSALAKSATGLGLVLALVAGLWLWQEHGLAIWADAAFSFCL